MKASERSLTGTNLDLEGDDLVYQPQLHLAAFMRLIGVLIGAQRYSSAYPDTNFNFRYLKHSVPRLEVAKFDEFTRRLTEYSNSKDGQEEFSAEIKSMVRFARVQD